MGKDIHLLIEIKMEDVWVPIDKIPENYNIRNYSFFNFLEENGNRGIPEELKDKKFRYIEEYDYWDFDLTDDYLFNHAFLSLAELKNCFKSLNRLSVSEEFIELFFDLGGKLPEGMTLDPDGNGIYVEIEDSDEMHVKNILKDGIEELEEIAKEYGVNEHEIRLVYAFDW